jgi:hypothetical protein
MSLKWSVIYQQCAKILLEDGGFQLGLITDDQFWRYAAEVEVDFMSKTGLRWKIFNVPLNFGIPAYSYPEQVCEIQSAVGAENYLFETSDFFLSNTNREWQTEMGTPEAYREDAIALQRIQVTPTPNVEGNQVITFAGQPGYGIISVVSNPNDFNILADPATPGLGVINGFNGNPYLDSTNFGYGVLASMVPSTGNLELFATALPYNVTGIGPDSYIESMPDSLTPYLKYGILAKIFSADSELKDEAKANYCEARYTEGCNFVGAVMSQILGPDAE